ncbi:MAG: SDR family oxidoreductase [Pseudomonadota bacterium]
MSRRIFITGGGSGIGSGLAKRFLSLGDKVAVTDVDQAALEVLKISHPEVLTFQADASSEVEMRAVFAQLEELWDSVDVVCANAGTGGPAGRIEELDLGAASACIEVNLMGAMITCAWAAKRMRAQGAGLIVLTSSTAGQHGYPFRAPYAAAKWGIVGLTKTLAMELGEAGVRVNAICPGAVEGDRMDRVVANEARAKGMSEQDVRAQYVTGVSLKTWVTVEDLADTVEWLASPKASKISGQIIAIDGHTETLNP